ncbi:high affinity copper uptake protein 1-like [Ciona intestinalis]
MRKSYRQFTKAQIFVLLLIYCVFSLILFVKFFKMNHNHHVMSGGDPMMHHMNMSMSAQNNSINTTMPPMNPHEGHNTITHGDEMHMTFYFGASNVQILFEGCTVNSPGAMIGACIAVCIIAMLYEGLKVLRESLLKKSVVSVKYATVNRNGGDESTYVGTNRTARQRIFSTPHFIQTLLHLIQVTVSYALMLIFMTYNAYLAIAIIIGAGLGYFLFGWKKAIIVDMNEHCH